jgi:hypothetical protein
VDRVDFSCLSLFFAPELAFGGSYGLLGDGQSWFSHDGGVVDLWYGVFLHGGIGDGIFS